MSGTYHAKSMTWGMHMVTAALLLADGEWVRCSDLATGLFPWPAPYSQIVRYVANLRRFGLPIEIRPRTGYRLTAIPPDEHLDDTLACVAAVKRSAWWSAQGSRTRMSA